MKKMNFFKKDRNTVSKTINDLNDHNDGGVKVESWASDYFKLAGSWADDIYTATTSSRNRWRAFSLYALTPVIILLLTCITMLIPTQHLVPLLINHYDDGMVSVSLFKNTNSPKSQQLVESDIVHYVINRESYSAYTYKEQYSLINLLSSGEVASLYRDEQNSANKSSPINTLGDKGSRSVQVVSVLFLDNENQNTSHHKANKQSNDKHRNLAQINFVISNKDKPDSTETKIPLTALISWDYKGTPKDPEEAWKNWDGFNVTYYEVQQQHVSNESGL